MPTKKGRKIMFYVFYDKWDFVRCFGTAYDLVKQGKFSSVNSVQSSAKKCLEKRPNSVVKIPVPKYARRSVLNARNIV